MAEDSVYQPNSTGIDPTNIKFTANLLRHASLIGVTRSQMERALRDPRWVNTVRHQPDPRGKPRPRRRFCGHGVAVIVQGNTALAVIADDPSLGPLKSA